MVVNVILTKLVIQLTNASPVMPLNQKPFVFVNLDGLGLIVKLMIPKKKMKIKIKMDLSKLWLFYW